MRQNRETVNGGKQTCLETVSVTRVTFIPHVIAGEWKVLLQGDLVSAKQGLKGASDPAQISKILSYLSPALSSVTAVT